MARLSIASPEGRKHGAISDIFGYISDRPKRFLAAAITSVLLASGSGIRVYQDNVQAEIQQALSSLPSPSQDKQKRIFSLEEAVLKECTTSESFRYEMSVVCEKNSALFLGHILRTMASYPNDIELRQLDALFSKMHYNELLSDGQDVIRNLATQKSFRESVRNYPNLQRILGEMGDVRDFSAKAEEILNPKKSFSEAVSNAGSAYNRILSRNGGQFETENSETIHDEYVRYAARTVLQELEVYKRLLAHLSLDTSVIDTAIADIPVQKTNSTDPFIDIPFSKCISLIGMQNNWPHVCDNIQKQVSDRVFSYAQAYSELLSGGEKSSAKKEETRLYRAIQKILTGNNQWLIGEIFSVIPRQYESLVPEDLVIQKKKQIADKRSSSAMKQSTSYLQWKAHLEEKIRVGDREIPRSVALDEMKVIARNAALALTRSTAKGNVDWILRDFSGNQAFGNALKEQYELQKPKPKKSRIKK